MEWYSLWKIYKAFLKMCNAKQKQWKQHNIYYFMEIVNAEDW